MGHAMIRWGSQGGVVIASGLVGNVFGPVGGVEAKFFRNWTFQSTGDFVATVTVQGTLDPTPSDTGNWGDIADISTPGAVATYDKPLTGVRIKVTNYVSGQVGALGAATP